MTEGGWRLVEFEDRLDRWISLIRPPVQLQRVVMRWVFTRIEDPYLGAKRDKSQSWLFRVMIPGTYHRIDEAIDEPTHAVLAYFQIDEQSHAVVFDSIMSLGLPID